MYVAGRVGVVEDLELGGRHVGVPHQFLGEDLAPLDPGRLLRRPEHLEPLAAQEVGQPRRERVFRADHDEPDLLLACRTASSLSVSVWSMATFVAPSPAVPALPGAQNTFPARGDCRSFHTSACSRPPLPITRTFIMGAASVRWSGSAGQFIRSGVRDYAAPSARTCPTVGCVAGQ